ncbi:5'-methylthioadenosine/adenosylhomocysteine nucleosidase [Alteromonas sp. a30]|uniref:5'-methylthioadenosine/adenosylhomocysteine nucleosidase n=1 Tax=Alteromonas sp. a30 TaxID=2730917 RepID=UPI00227F6BBF|nr:5'-methylthioadenosine/adenosylhomocysteine nucleosidase [Alteromonas sp. a30]MCY7294495.1 5'-methylthioadenosine/adenosylhomocysteine nucleosidase [Alteromonas sp. a30]
MKVGILGALEQEIALLQAQMDNKNTFQHGQLHFITGTLHGVDIVLVRCGVGKVAAAIAASSLIQCYAPDYVVNTGSAGGFDTELNIGDVVVANEVMHHDVDVTHFGFEPGQVFDMPARYVSDNRLIKAATKAAANLTHLTTKQGLICSGDAFIGCDDAAAKLRNTFPDMSAVEMEGAAIGQACYTLNTPFVVIRSLSDIAGKTSTISFQTYLEKAGEISAQIVLGMIENLIEENT